MRLDFTSARRCAGATVSGAFDDETVEEVGDIDLEALVVTPTIQLSTPASMRLPLRWIAMLSGRIEASLAATSGIHHGGDALKMLLAGADVTMLCSVLMQRGIPHCLSMAAVPP